jgi:septal ring-binding cell division protein DamX
MQWLFLQRDLPAPQPLAPPAANAATTPVESAAPIGKGDTAPTPAAATPAPEPQQQAAAAEPPKSTEEPTPPPKPAGPLLGRDQLRRISAYPVGMQKLARERIAAAQERLAAEPDESYAIELFTTDNSDPARLERFLIRARALVPLEDIYVIPMAGPRRYRVRVVYGAYSNQEGANAALVRLPPKYKQAFAPLELRSYRELRQSI